MSALSNIVFCRTVHYVLQVFYPHDKRCGLVSSRHDMISPDMVFNAVTLQFGFHWSGWNELLIASFSHRSIALKDGVLLASELQRDSAHGAGVGAIFDRYV